jgi:uncharacterized glyoxalase superfamily protein PhnB
MTGKIAPCLWFNGQAEEAANFYASVFPDSRVKAVHRAPGDFPSGQQGDVLMVEFTVLGMDFLGLNGGPQFSSTRQFRSGSIPTTRRRPTVTGMRSSAAAARRARAAGARTASACRGRLPPSA